MNDLFEKLEGVGFLPVPHKKAVCKSYGALEVCVTDLETAYRFGFSLFYYGTCYNYHHSVSKKMMELNPIYWKSAQEILNYEDQGRAGQILIEALVKRQMTKIQIKKL